MAYQMLDEARKDIPFQTPTPESKANVILKLKEIVAHEFFEAENQ